MFGTLCKVPMAPIGIRFVLSIVSSFCAVFWRSIHSACTSPGFPIRGVMTRAQHFTLPGFP